MLRTWKEQISTEKEQNFVRSWVMFDNSNGIWLFDDANASFNSISFKRIYKFKMIWLCPPACLWHGKYGYKQLHVGTALRPTGGDAWGISSDSHSSGQEVLLNERNAVPVIRLCSWQHGDILREIPCNSRKACQKYSHSTHRVSQLGASGMLDALQPVLLLHLCFLSDVYGRDKGECK